jgi:hypothetical protein
MPVFALSPHRIATHTREERQVFRGLPPCRPSFQGCRIFKPTARETFSESGGVAVVKEGGYEATSQSQECYKSVHMHARVLGFQKAVLEALGGGELGAA